MRKFELKDMVKGWFVGDFSPTVFQTSDVEVAIKNYLAGEKENAHVHKVATEITVVVTGKVLMSGVEYTAGDIVVIEPNCATDFEALEDTTTAVVKLPSVKGDKYLVDV